MGTGRRPAAGPCSAAEFSSFPEAGTSSLNFWVLLAVLPPP